MKYSSIKVVAFDLFGTLVKMDVPREEVKKYVKIVHQDEWEPLYLPSSWNFLQVFPDVKEGLNRIREKCEVVTLSNGPLYLQRNILRFNDVQVNLVVPLELIKVYKPKPAAYQSVLDLYRINPSEMLMVTANPTFGDVEAAQSLGINTAVIRNTPEHPYKDVIDLSENIN